MKEINIPIQAEEDSFLPTYATAEAAGADVKAFINEPLTIAPGARALVPTGLKTEIPPGYEIQVRPRSGLAVKHGITVLNSPGTIDSDYRGEIQIILINLSHLPFEITPGMRIAQLVVAPVTKARFDLCETLQTSSRGEKGFGHTGTH